MSLPAVHWCQRHHFLFSVAWYACLHHRDLPGKFWNVAGVDIASYIGCCCCLEGWLQLWGKTIRQICAGGYLPKFPSFARSPDVWHAAF